MIQLEKVTKSYPGGEAVIKAVNLHIRPGEYAALTGPSGSGKSTLMNILGCLDTPTAGRYLLDGMDVSRLTPAQLCQVRREKIGFVFQGYQLLSKLSAAENVAYPLMLRGMEPDQRRLLALKALRQVGLSGREDARPSQLSGGQQQRVALARALCCKPKLLLCDEPTGALDPASRDDILALLDGWNRRGNTVVVITHDPVVAAQAATRYHAQPGGQLIRVQ
ncbi:MAG: ABC transporter ATP-binding protein [Candidatus Limiplasma sp.]|nr:ABC transporter ATP-binding protein [Candidatus Limiplasma sp.]